VNAQVSRAPVAGTGTAGQEAPGRTRNVLRDIEHGRWQHHTQMAGERMSERRAMIVSLCRETQPMS
jgi:hypothetical protein